MYEDNGQTIEKGNKILKAAMCVFQFGNEPLSLLSMLSADLQVTAQNTADQNTISDKLSIVSNHGLSAFSRGKACLSMSGLQVYKCGQHIVTSLQFIKNAINILSQTKLTNSVAPEPKGSSPYSQQPTTGPYPELSHTT
jgi:hypothetical protein